MFATLTHVKSIVAAGVMFLCLFLSLAQPADSQEQIFFPSAEEHRNPGADFASRVYDCDFTLSLDDTSTVQMIRPSGLCFADDRTLLLLDGASGVIHRFDLLTRRFTGQFGREGNHPGEFMEPRSIVPLPGGGFAVADSGSHRIQFLDDAFMPLEPFGRLGDRDDRNGLAQPQGMAVGGKRLYICDRYNSVVKVFGLETRQSRATIGYDRFASGKSLLYPTDCTTHGDILAVADNGNDRVVFYSIERSDSGRFLRAVGAEPEKPRFLAGPVAVEFDGAGNLWIADRGNRRVVKMERPVLTGTIAVEFTAMTDGGSFVSPADLVVNSRGELAVLDDEAKTLSLFRADHFAKGRAAYRARDFAEAYHRFALDREAARRAGTESAYSVFYMAQCRELTGRYREAYDLYKELVATFDYGYVRIQAEFRIKALRPLLPPQREAPRR